MKSRLSGEEELMFSYFQERFDNHYERSQLNIEEYEKIINDLNNKSSKEKENMFDDLIYEYGGVVSKTIIQSFGLSHLFHQDQHGGEVTTIHNSQKNIIAQDKDKYDRSKYEYESSRKIVLQQNEKRHGGHIDAYTGKTIERPNVDHVIPLHAFHKNGGFLLKDEAKRAFSSDNRNLVVTDETLNKSKGNQQLDEFRNRKVNGQHETNDLRFSIDEDRAQKIALNANIAYDEHQVSTGNKLRSYAVTGVAAGLQDGLKLGVREAVGIILHTLNKELFKELKSYTKMIKNYREDKVMIYELNKMMKRINLSINQKLKGLLSSISLAFGEGVISGLISSILTTIINMFVTTKKRIVRIIREGFLSIFHALKILMTNPQKLSKSVLYREVTKLIITGIIAAGGITLEGAIEQFLNGLGIPFIPLITSTLVGILTGVALVTVLYMIDQVWGMLPSTEELLKNSSEIIENRYQLQEEFEFVTQGLPSKNIVDRIVNSDRNVNDTVDYFEE
ncbi:DUF1524 domain-containing protein [Exiguobacterium acetylicum]|uniref:DUF1524 domain-containing protein n=1 Tax=Exiguobacterium acetylicum TaxID=41170 RepID=UPI001EE309E7|nr:DUF1524 domain-containing protein [Exiguobacterium acetylicum]UKS55687.1 DUF1524 domain-containing protein [Exiguobacterium acetylicum]